MTSHLSPTESARHAETCEIAAVLSRGAQKRKCESWAKQHWRNAMNDYQPTAGTETMSDVELLAALDEPMAGKPYECVFIAGDSGRESRAEHDGKRNLFTVATPLAGTEGAKPN